MAGVHECVVNVSEGRDLDALAVMAAAAGDALLDVHTDGDHHRSVLTLGGDLVAVEAAVRGVAAAALEVLDLTDHEGVHPRLGVVDVVPFVALAEEGAEEARDAARRFGRWLADEHGVPVFFYDDADVLGRSLPETRRAAFSERAPDLGPPRPHPRAGATAVGARPPLVALNCELTTADAQVAAAVARRVREVGGGLPGVRALGFDLPSRGRAQVSMNLVDLGRTGVEAAATAVREAARELGSDVQAVELVGLVPQAEADRWSAGFVTWSGIDPTCTVEMRLTRSAGSG